MMRIRTGKYIREYISDKKVEQYIEKIKPNLKNEKYEKAVLQLINLIDDRVNTNFLFIYDTFASFVDWITSILIFPIFLMIIGCCVWLCEKKVSLDSKSEDKLKRIKEICEKKKPKKEFLNETCIICLEPLEDHHTNSTNTINPNVVEEEKEIEPIINPDEVPKFELPKRDIGPQKENDVLLEKKESSDNFIAKLECGHSFHSNCIANWMTKQNSCPICKNKIDEEDSSQHSGKNVTARNLVDIQMLLHPDFSNIQFNYAVDSFTWSLRSTSSSSFTGSSYSGSWNFGSGGGSGKW